MSENKQSETKKRKLEETQETNDEIISKLKFSIDPQTLKDCKRLQCPKCKKNRKYFCYSTECMTPLGDKKIPNVKLPLKVIILQHPKELKGKSTAIHARVLSPNDVQIFQYPDIPDFLNAQNSVILYPGKDAIPLEELLAKKEKKQEEKQLDLKYVVFIDATWQQSKKIARDERLSGLKRVMITKQKTLFWRYQKFGKDHLATIEAIYFFLKEWHEKSGKVYNGEYDDLLFYYIFMYNMIQENYQSDPQKKFKRIENYIQYKKPKLSDTQENK